MPVSDPKLVCFAFQSESAASPPTSEPVDSSSNCSVSAGVVLKEISEQWSPHCRCTQIGGIGYISQQLGECKWLKACWFSSWSEPARSSSIEAAWQMYSRQGHRRHHPPFENSSSWLSAKHHNTLLCKQKSQRIKSLKVWPCVHFWVVLGILLVFVHC